MDVTDRQITKIGREAQRFSSKVLKDSGIGPSEYELIHCVRHAPGISQEGVRKTLGLDKAAVARRAANLEKKGYLFRRRDPNDGRGKQLFVTEKTNDLKQSSASVEGFFYEWLFDGEVTEAEKAVFVDVLARLYHKAKAERRTGFVNLIALEEKRHGGSET